MDQSDQRPALYDRQEPDFDPLEADSVQEAVLVREEWHGAPAIAMGDESKDEWIRSDQCVPLELLHLW